MLEGLANGARGENPRVSLFHLRDNFDPKAVPFAGLGERRRRARTALAEMKVPSDDDRGRSEPLNQNFRDELVRAHRCERGVKMDKNETCQPESGAYRGLVAGRRQSKNDLASGEEVDGMRFERQESARGRSLFRHRDSAPDDGLMPAMQAVKIPDCVDRALQPVRRQHRVRGEHEAVGHRVLPVSGVPPSRTCVSSLTQQPFPRDTVNRRGA